MLLSTSESDPPVRFLLSGPLLSSFHLLPSPSLPIILTYHFFPLECGSITLPKWIVKKKGSGEVIESEAGTVFVKTATKQ